MAEFDYSAWIARAQAFTERLKRSADAQVRSTAVAAPASDQDLAAIESALGTRLPASLRAFFRQGAAGLDCKYIVEPTGEAFDQLMELLPDQSGIYGGARIGPLSELPDMSAGVAAWATDTWVAEDDVQRVIWESARPFLHLANGDYLALDLREKTDPPVVYLNHDDESVAIAPGFDEFLRRWEGLCYLGPEHWLLLPFVGGDGYLDATSSRGARLRGMLPR
jgi:SMI1 / KNR4 family (SUKH-1)